MANRLDRELGGIEGREEVTLGADKVPGDIVQTPSGTAAFLFGLKDLKSGEKVACSTDCLVRVASASATTFSAGAVVQYNASTKLAVASGDFIIGVAEKAKTNGQTEVLVRLNHPKAFDTNT